VPSSRTIAIIGAGPYGLSAAAHLGRLPNTKLLVFGRPMSFWQDQMPRGMFLRSGWRASYIADPEQALTLEKYQSGIGERVPTPVPLDRFVSYGMWFQKQVVPELDTRLVERVTPISDRFRLSLEGGDTTIVDRVVVTAGIAPFAYTPPEFSSLPNSLASHASEHKDFAAFRGKNVAVVGGGQSALESAALLKEAGADVQVFVREKQLHFLGWRKRITRFQLLSKLLYSWTDVGPAGLSQLVSHPDYFRFLPRGIQDPIARRCIRPAGAGWLRSRLDGVRLHLGRTIVDAQVKDSRLKLQTGTGSSYSVDHLLIGTGYKVEISKYRFLSPELLASIRQTDGYPSLNEYFESSVPGLYFLGAPAAWSFGPLMRFVAGAGFGCARLATSLGRLA
jgi:FAD-dependent urate hydroxylase